MWAGGTGTREEWAGSASEGSVAVLRSTFACMHFAHFPLLAPPFDGQKSTRSRVHFKLNLFAGPSAGVVEQNTRIAEGVRPGGSVLVIHYFDSLTSIHLVVLVACHLASFRFHPELHNNVGTKLEEN